MELVDETPYPIKVFQMPKMLQDNSHNYKYGAENAHKNKHKQWHTHTHTHKASENPLDAQVTLGHVGGVPAKLPISVSVSQVNNRKSLGHRPVEPCLSCHVSQEHPASVGIFLSFCGSDCAPHPQPQNILLRISVCNQVSNGNAF